MAFSGNFSLHPVEAFRTQRSGRCVTRPLTKGRLELVRQRETGIKVMRVRVGSLLAALALQLAASQQAIAEDPHLGVIEYELSCMPCHGLGGHGDGPRARTLQTKPADLTKIARANNGDFPTAKVANIIDGCAHPGRSMGRVTCRFGAIAIASVSKQTNPILSNLKLGHAPTSQHWSSISKRSRRGRNRCSRLRERQRRPCVSRLVWHLLGNCLHHRRRHFHKILLRDGKRDANLREPGVSMAHSLPEEGA